MEHTTAKFPSALHGISENSLRITYKRDLTTNPLPDSCGEGYTVEMFASDEDIDAQLPIPGIWPGTGPTPAPSPTPLTSPSATPTPDHGHGKHQHRGK